MNLLAFSVPSCSMFSLFSGIFSLPFFCHHSFSTNSTQSKLQESMNKPCVCLQPFWGALLREVPLGLTNESRLTCRNVSMPTGRFNIFSSLISPIISEMDGRPLRCPWHSVRAAQSRWVPSHHTNTPVGFARTPVLFRFAFDVKMWL